MSAVARKEGTEERAKGDGGGGGQRGRPSLLFYGSIEAHAKRSFP